MVYKLVTGGDTACPAFARWVKADLIGPGRIDASQPDLGGIDLDRVAINDAWDAGDVGRSPKGWRGGD
jgi:hypothetical protein